MDSKIGQHLAHHQKIGSYRLLSVIGHGGFADVYLAEHTYLQTRVALKIFRARPNDEQMEIFLAQTRKLARLQHAHILPILACNVQNGCPFLVMPYAPGGTLRQRYPRGSHVPLDTVLAYLHQVAPALDIAHRAGQVHGDIKPENMLLGEQDELLLSDFGLAPIVEDAHEKPQPLAIGTVTYMAPEQLLGQTEPSSDQYALAIATYEWLCGEPPFSGTYTEVATQHALVNPPSLRQHCPDLPPPCEQVLLRALAKNPRERFESVQAFTNAMEQAASTPARSDQPAKRGISRRRLLWGLAGAGGVAALGADLVWKWQPFSKPTPGGVAALYTYRGHADRVYGLTWSPDSTRLASVDLSGSVRIWQATAQGSIVRGKLLASRTIGPAHNTLDGSGDPTSLTWSPETNLIALGDNPGKIHIWDSVSQQDRLVLRDYPNLGTCVAWSPNSTQLAAAVYIDSQNALIVAFWDITTGNRLADLQLTSKFQLSTASTLIPMPLALAWSPNGKLIALSNGSSATQIWELPGGRLLYALRTGSNDLAWSPDSKYLATANSIWDSATGLPYHTYAGANNSAAWSLAGTYLATGGKDKIVSLWDTSTSKLIRTYQGHTAPINVVRWSPDGSLIASASDDHTVRIFAL
ncbi:MAG TPA: serine/threonine-protein kinase [Ktedonobacteraceae bacterium]|jgi:WD40 repeat protein/tRNA A-37 threonylcarbamoyl transferase component Bud32|nr:serine/threonine-protein kinase [Ktedonobacteraceae bacterium]